MKTWAKVLLVIIGGLALGAAVFMGAAARAISQTTASGPVKIVRVSSAFFTARMTNKTPFGLTIEKVTFLERSESACFDGEYYVLVDPQGGIPAAESEVPSNFRIAEGSTRVAPTEEVRLGVVVSSTNGERVSVGGMILHCKIGPFRIRVRSDVIFEIEPS